MNQKRIPVRKPYIPWTWFRQRDGFLRGYLRPAVNITSATLEPFMHHSIKHMPNIPTPSRSSSHLPAWPIPPTKPAFPSTRLKHNTGSLPSSRKVIYHLHQPASLSFLLNVTVLPLSSLSCHISLTLAMYFHHLATKPLLLRDLCHKL